MIRAATLAVALLFATPPALAQTASPEEISFWESVRDSKNPAELQAYIDQYPNGRFAVLAKARLAALSQKPATAPAPLKKPAVTAALPSGPRMPQAGDSWTYRLSYPRLRGQWGQTDRPPATYVVTIGEARGGQIVDLFSVDGGTQTQVTHSSDVYLAPEGVSILSPYLTVYRDLPPAGSVGSIKILDGPCNSPYGCRATGRVMGKEKVQVPAGEFEAIKVVIEQNWWPISSGMGISQLGRMQGGRTLTVWYVPEIKRAVKYASRITVGDAPAVEPTFDLELMSYQVK